MKKFYLLLVCTLIWLNSFSQGTISLDTIIPFKKDMINFNLFDTLNIVSYSEPQLLNSLYFTINNERVDTLNRKLIRETVYFNKNIIFNSNLFSSFEKEEYIRFRYDISQKKLVAFDFGFNHDSGVNQFFRYKEDNYLKLFIINPITGESELFVDFFDFVEKEEVEGKIYPLASIDNVFFINRYKAIISICIQSEFEGCEGYNYFLVTNNNVLNVTKNVVLEDGLNTYKEQYSSIEFVSVDRKYIRESSRTPGGDKDRVSRLFDEDLNYISGLLDFTENKIEFGINIQEDKLENHFLISFLNNRTKVIIPYKFIPELEIALYKAYNDTILAKEEIQDLGKYELGILRNLLFAKYNYDFNAEFYQAYFNLFAFYNHPDMRKTRTKNVDNLLTDSDRKNLEIIRNLESKIEE
ncbi:MAG: YARHG domain-containing protein [Bacteroidales bacterium]|jgi:hypothetical protein|nr:YARHG domain-containing protein [Bacteroidales bacterium]